MDSILRLAAGKHGMRRDAPSEVCAVFDGEYWGDLITAKAEDYAATVDIGSLLYGYQFKDKDPDGSRAEHLVDPNFFPQVEIFYTRDACSDLSSRFPRAIPRTPLRQDLDNHSATPTFIMGDMNSLSPGDDAFYVASGLAAHVDRLRFNHDGAQGGVDKHMEQIGKLLHRKFMLRDRKPLDSSRIDYRPVQALLDKGWLDLLAAGDESVGDSENFKYTVPTAVQADFMHVQRMRLDGILANPAAVDSFGLASPQAFIAKSINSPCTEILSDHLPVAVTLQWHDVVRALDQR